MTAPALEAHALSYSVKRPDGSPLELVRDVDLDVAPGEHLSVVGRSGSGKTTLLTLMGLLATPTRGRIIIRGRDTSHATDDQRARIRLQEIGFVFQSYSLIPHLNAYDNVALPLRYGPVLSRGEEHRLVLASLDRVQLGSMGRKYPRALSGGEQQRVAIARALVRSPGIVLADEPTGALDTATGETVLSELQRATADSHCSLVVVTHDPVIAAAGDRTVTMTDGALVHEGAARSTAPDMS